MVAEETLRGELTAAQGQMDQAFTTLRSAVAHEDPQLSATSDP